MPACISQDSQNGELGPKETRTVTIGWIHLHQIFCAFLSSIDQHMQADLQTLQPLALAIVVDGRTDTPSFFRLTDHGLAYTRNCKSTGLHEHENVEPLTESVDVTILPLDTVEACLHSVFVACA